MTMQKSVEQSEFIKNANQLLGQAMNPETSVGDSMNAANSLRVELAAIKAGSLAVEPPLSVDQFNHYETASNMVTAIGNKVLNAKNETETRSVQQRSRQESGHSRSRIFRGKGASAK